MCTQKLCVPFLSTWYVYSQTVGKNTLVFEQFERIDHFRELSRFCGVFCHSCVNVNLQVCIGFCEDGHQPLRFIIEKC